MLLATQSNLTAIFIRNASLIVCVFCLIASGLPVNQLQGQPTPATPQPTPKVDDPKTPAITKSDDQQSISAEREAEIMGFALEHHAAIIPLLEVLKKQHAARFQRVIQGLDRELKVLARIKQRSDDSYAIALKQWVNRSKIRLLTAEVKTAASVSDIKKIREKLRQLLQENHDARIQTIQLDIKTTKARLDKMSATVKELQGSGSDTIEKRVQAITKVPARLKKAKRNRSATQQD